MPGWYRTTAAASWRFVAIAAAVYLVMYSLVHLRVIVLPIIVALLASTLLLPVTRWLRQHGLPDAAAAALSMLSAFALLAVIFTLIAPSVVDQFGDLRTQAEDGVRQASDQLAQPPFNLSEAICAGGWIRGWSGCARTAGRWRAGCNRGRCCSAR